jgi:hypothetical protein
MYTSDNDSGNDSDIDDKWMKADILEYKENYEKYETFRANNTVPNKVIILNNEDYSVNMGYTIEQCGQSPLGPTAKSGGRRPDDFGQNIYTTFWAGPIGPTTKSENNTEIEEKKIIYSSLDNLYEQSKIFVESDLINHSLLHQIKYKMMCDFISHYESQT